MKAEIKLTFLLLFLFSASFGQVNQYRYKRELPGIKDQWHKIIIPQEMFGKVLPDLSDIRIFGIKANKDTIEAPYILQTTTEKISQKYVTLKLINCLSASLM